MQKSRPEAIVIVFILAIINGIILLVVGILAIYSVPSTITSEFDIISNISDANELNPETRSMLMSTIISVVYAVAFVSVALGLAWFGLAWGLFTNKIWAWLVTVILAIITLVFSIFSIGTIVNITTLIISGVILYYMYRPQVKSYFGRVSIPK
jgi:lysylphosphatidylglycerol synthetase-like protein (DUF2156 family)